MLPEPIDAEKNLEFSLDNPNNELELIQMAVNGDTNVFKRLFDTNVSRIYAFLPKDVYEQGAGRRNNTGRFC